MRVWITATILALLGCVQAIADVAGYPTIRAIANATQVSPAMKVFTSHAGYETFSSRFSLEYTSTTGEAKKIELTPERYAGLAGPYNRRNTYGAALSYAPVLLSSPRTEGMVTSVMRYALCDPAPLVAELGLAELNKRSPVVVRIRPRQPQPNRPLIIEVRCDDK
jgi:hypothetical protein